MSKEFFKVSYNYTAKNLNFFINRKFLLGFLFMINGFFLFLFLHKITEKVPKKVLPVSL